MKVNRNNEEGQPLLSNEPKQPLSASPHAIGISTEAFAGICYCFASGAMVLMNKHALASFGFSAPTALLCFQCTIAASLVKICELAGLIDRVQPLRWHLIKLWFPVNLIFVGMLTTSFYALKEMGVGMVTVWKNLSNVVTAFGDLILFGKSYSWQVWTCLALMVLSAAAGASTDVRFSVSGYSWQAANCVFTSAYALYLRSVMDEVAAAAAAANEAEKEEANKAAVAAAAADAQQTQPWRSSPAAAVAGVQTADAAERGLADGHMSSPLQRARPTAEGVRSAAPATAPPVAAHVPPTASCSVKGRARGGFQMDELSMVYYNNALSVPPLLVLAWATGELSSLTSQPALSEPAFLIVAGVSGLLSFAVSAASLWYLSQTSATLYSLVGALNKIPVAALGIVAFQEPSEPRNLAAIAIGLGGGVMFACVRSRGK